jgi:hypothetical protein
MPSYTIAWGSAVSELPPVSNPLLSPKPFPFLQAIGLFPGSIFFPFVRVTKACSVSLCRYAFLPLVGALATCALFRLSTGCFAHAD